MKRIVCAALVLFALMATGTSRGVAQKPLFTAADTQELLAFKLTDQGVENYYKATMAVGTWAKAHPNTKFHDDDENKDASDTTISDMVAHFSKFPQFDALMKSNGLTTRQYVDTFMILVPGLAMVDMEREGQKFKPSPIISAANVDYIRKNHDHITKLMTEMASAGGDQ
ncbi:MAG TPA: hypothetical protein VNU92_05650 [Edaphobacter sp.]|jgi:hypothetical protein|nr:hypothetical protein [Edaphobacter sp.]